MAGTRTERKYEGNGVVSEGVRRRMEAEKEFLERQYKERKLSRTVRGDPDSAASSQMESESETDTSKKRTRWSPNDGGNKAKSRKVEETEYEDSEGSDDDDELHLGLDPLENLGKTLRKMRNWFKLPQGILRTAVREELRVGQEGNEARNQDTFAQALGRKEVPKITGVKGPVLPVPKLVVVKQENKESEERKKEVEGV
ncbi:hypothetical protein J6590_032234 [Homalodisca vitripennis]|nr:hypothetical protein J6590_032234 [Homalodisca vitripennis]